MSKFKIGNIEIKHLSGPISLSLLKPTENTFNTFKSYGGRAPYILLLGDSHYSRENDCVDCSENCNCKKNCCYKIDDPCFLRALDEFASPKFPIHFYIEQMFDPNLAEKYSEHKFKNMDDIGYLSKFVHDYKICYVKEERSSSRYKKECPTKFMKWNYIDTRNIYGGNNKDKFLKMGINLVECVIRDHFKKDSKGTDEELYQLATHLSNQHLKGLQYLHLHLTNSPEFVKKYIVPDSKFLLSKQIEKQLIDGLKDFSNWQELLIEKQNQYFEEYLKDYDINIFIYYMKLYLELIALLFNERESKNKDFFIKKKEQIYKLFIVTDDFNHYASKTKLENLFLFVYGPVYMDIYTISRIFKEPTGDYQSFLSIVYAGYNHTENIAQMLTKRFGYTVSDKIDESFIKNDVNNRCLDVSNFDFDLNKIRSLY